MSADELRSVEPSSRPPRLALDWFGAWVASVIGWLWLYPDVYLGLHWQDTSEFIATGRSLSLAHPPGHPLTLLSIHLAQLLPWLDTAARGHLASSFWGIIGVGSAYLALQSLAFDDTRASPLAPRWTDRLSWLVGSLIIIGAPLVWLQVCRAEVYASQWALSSVVWAGVIYASRARDQRGWLVAALGLGLLGANHTLLAVALGVALLPRLITLRLTSRVWITCLCTALLGLSLYLYVWWRGRWGGVSGWGWIEDGQSWWEHVSAKVWQVQVSARAAEVDFGHNCVQLLGFSLEQVGLMSGAVITFVITLGGVRWVTHRSASSQVSWGPTLTLATFCIAFTKLTYPLSTQNPDFSGYLAAGAPSAILLLITATRRVSERWVLWVSLITFGGVLTQHGDQRPPESMGAEAWGRQVTSEVSTGGVLWSSFYSTHFITSALWVSEGWRPDIRLAFRGHREMKWAQRRLNLIPSITPLPSLERDQALTLQSSRYEVESPFDAKPWLWPHLSLPGDQYGALTSALLSQPYEQMVRGDESRVITPSSSPHVDSHRMRLQTMRLLRLGDARPLKTSIAPDHLQAYLCDEDTAYAWALYHELNLRWLASRKGATQDPRMNREMTLAIEAHQTRLRWWNKQIALAQWDQLYFSWPNP